MTRIKRVSREKYKGFIEKAEQYYQGMDDEYEKKRLFIFFMIQRIPTA